MDFITVTIVEDIQEIREGICALIERAEDLVCIDVFDSAEDALHGILLNPPHITLIDIALPGMSGIDCIQQLKARRCTTQFLIFTIFEDSDRVFEALAAGANGYLLKSSSPEKILESIRELHAGGSPMSTSIARKVVRYFYQQSDIRENGKLSPREVEVLSLLAKGLLYKEVAERLFISTGTVRQHIHHIYEKLHVQNRTEAINKFYGRKI